MQRTDNIGGGGAPAVPERKRKKRGGRGGGLEKRQQRERLAQRSAEGGREEIIRAEVGLVRRAACIVARNNAPTVAPVGFAEEGEHCHGLELLVGSPSALCTPPDARAPRAQYDSNGRWLVEGLAVGDGSEAAGGFVLELDVPHETDQARSPREAFHPIEWDEGLFAGVRDGAIIFSTYAIPGSRAEATGEETPDVFIPARGGTPGDDELDRSAAVAAQVLSFLQRHPGVAVIMSGIGARDAVAWESGVQRKVPGQPRRTASTHDCIKAAIINAVFALRGEVVADMVQQGVDADVRFYTSFAPLGEVMQAARESRTRCRSSRDPEVQCAILTSDRLAPFRLLAAKRGGVFIVRLRAVKGVDHAVVVDANNGIIIYSEEASALVLSAEVLERCGGYGVRDLRVTDVRRIKDRDE